MQGASGMVVATSESNGRVDGVDGVGGVGGVGGADGTSNSGPGGSSSMKVDSNAGEADEITEVRIGSVDHYDPNYLDDGTIKQGKSRLITSGPSHRHSFLPYVKRRDLKDEINAQFRELHPWLPTSMSLSKIRTLKRESLEQWKKHDLELSTLALGIVYFERLVIKTLVMKTNRKLKFAACLLLAYKFNEGESKSEEEIMSPTNSGQEIQAATNNSNTTTMNGPLLAMQHVFDSIERSLGISRKELFRIELQVFAELDFDLSIPPEKLMPHFLRLLDTLDSTPKEYLGGKRMRMFFRYDHDEEDEDEEPIMDEERRSGRSASDSKISSGQIYSDVSDIVVL